MLGWAGKDLENLPWREIMSSGNSPLKDATKRVVNEDVHVAGTPGSAKKLLLAKQKSDSARKIRQEKRRLKEEKQRKQEEFLRAKAEARERSSQKSQARRMALVHEKNALQASKELEIQDRQWKLEQERLHRQELDARKKQQAHEENQLKEQERKEKLEAERKEKEQADAQRKAECLLAAEELEQKNFLRQLEKQKKQHQADLAAAERRERMDRQAEEEYLNAKRELESRALDEAARQDTIAYIEKEKARRRQSVAVKIQQDRDWKQKQYEQQSVAALHEKMDRELERLAYEDTKNYLAQEKEKRRQSLADYLRQESEYRRLQELERDQARQAEASSRLLDLAARQDVENHKLMEEERRRLSLQRRLQEEREQELAQEMEKLEQERMEDERREAERRILEQERLAIEEQRKNTQALEMQALEKELEAARKIEAHKEKELAQLEQQKLNDVQDYTESVQGLVQAVEQVRKPNSGQACDFPSLEAAEGMDSNMIQQDSSSESEQIVETQEKEQDQIIPVRVQQQQAAVTLPPPPALAQTPAIPSPPIIDNERPSRSAAGCCIIS